MRFLFCLALICIHPIAAQAQSVIYEVAPKPWPAEHGTHRAVCHVAQAAPIVRIHLPWRRRDARPEEKGVLVFEAASGKRVMNVTTRGISQEAGDVIFEAGTAGEYFVYFLPGSPGSGSFPTAKYLPPQETADAAWKAGLRAPAEARLVRWEARTTHDRFTEMEIIATAAERAVWLVQRPDAAFAVFPETRERAVRMFDHVPELWLKRVADPEFVVRPNEFFSFQLAVWAARGELRDLHVSFSDITGPAGARLPASLLRCLQTSGVNWDAKPLARRIDVPAGRVQPLWCALDLAADASAGRYTGTAEITAEGYPPQRVPIVFNIAGPALPDRGDSEPARLTKLRWLDSTIAQDDEPTRPFTPLKVEGRTVRLLGRSISLGDDGLPQRIASFFHPGVTRIVDQATEVLDGPMRFVVEITDGRTQPLEASGFVFGKANAGAVEWTARSSGGDFALALSGHIEFDGQVEIRCTVSAMKPIEVRDIRLEIPRTAATTPLITGLGQYGGASPATLDWKWDVLKRDQDAVWLGAVNAGLRVQLRAENYVRPYVNIHYERQPLNTPPSWDNAGRGGIRLADNTLTCFSGPRTLDPAQPLHFDFDLSITPFRPLDTTAQWRDRYQHGGGITDPAQIRATGANVVNIHQGNALNPYINYPFLTADRLRDYAAKIHAEKMRVKYYYTVRELTNWTPELFAMRAFGSELLAPGKGGGHAWCEEHFGGDYWQAWYEPGADDASILTSSMSRWHNLYLEGLRWLIENAGCDGLYLDDISFDRTVMKRARKILDRTNPRGGLIDLHSWNEMNDWARQASCVLLFMDSLPFVDRLWFGEGHHYDGPPEQTLVGVSGIPFGLMGEMLEGGGNPWLGLTFGMTNRLGWGGNPRVIWKLWDDFGVQDAEFIGWWDAGCPVKASAPDVKVTLWKRGGRTLVSVGNFSAKPVRTMLAIDWPALGLDPAKASLWAPKIDGFQPELLVRPDAVIALAPKRGFAFWLDEQKRDAPATLDTLALEKRRVLFEDRFLPKAADGWKTIATAKAEVQFDGEGQVFLAPAHTHAWTARVLPPGTRIIAAQIRQDAGDAAQQWGPGLAVIAADGKFVKVNRRDDGRFGLSINGAEDLAGQCDRTLPVILAVIFDEKRVRIVAAGEGAFEQEQELATLPRSAFPAEPSELRIGKMPNSLQPIDHGDPGMNGWSRTDWVRVLGE